MDRFLPIAAVLVACVALSAQTPVGNPSDPTYGLQPQTIQRPEACLPCHQRQYNELRTSVKAGYRTVSPLFNGLEAASNFLNGGLLRPAYSDSTAETMTNGAPLTTNLTTTPAFTDLNQVRAGFCLSCHNSTTIALGDKSLAFREVPALPGTGAKFDPTIFRPLRDYAMRDSNGNQLLPSAPGGPPPPGALPSLGAAGITCETCHNSFGPDMTRSLHNDGFANTSLLITGTVDKVGPFQFPLTPKGQFHTATRDPNRIGYLRSGLFCNGCHDVRVPLAAGGSMTAAEGSSQTGGSAVTFFRLENLSTEWALGPYNSTSNPFGQVVRCQDCHMSGFPYAGTSTYTVGTQTITSPTPGIFPQDYAAVPGVSLEFDNPPLSKRQVVTHYLTGVDVPLLSLTELRARLGSNYPDPYDTSIDAHGYPAGIAQRRQDLLKAAVRISLAGTDSTVALGGTFNVRLTATALTGHRFPAGFSQERTGYVQLTVKDANGVLLYQSGYVVDKPHPDTGEMAPDGNLDDEDLEHINAIVSGGRYNATYATGQGPNLNGATNDVFSPGPDNGPDSRVYAGIPDGLVLFRNELTRIFLPGSAIGRNDANGNPIVVTSGAHFEETFSASFANSVDNYRSLTPLRPTLYKYQIQLPTAAELAELGITAIQGPLQVSAQVNYEHFPPLFVRFLAKATGTNGPAGHDLGLLNEGVIDTYLVNLKNLTSASTTVAVQQ
jgi:hypothetical protein